MAKTNPRASPAAELEELAEEPDRLEKRATASRAEPHGEAPQEAMAGRLGRNGAAPRAMAALSASLLSLALGVLAIVFAGPVRDALRDRAHFRARAIGGIA